MCHLLLSCVFSVVFGATLEPLVAEEWDTSHFVTLQMRKLNYLKPWHIFWKATLVKWHIYKGFQAKLFYLYLFKGLWIKKKKAFQLHVTVRKDHSSLDCLCQNRLWLFLPAKIGSEIQKTTWLWIYRLQTRSQYFVILNHTKKKADGRCYFVDSLMSPLHNLHQQAQFFFFF